MITFYYGSDEIPVLQFDGFQISSPIEEGADKSLVINIVVPKTPSTEMLFEEPFEEVTITDESGSYYYSVNTVTKEKDQIKIKLTNSLNTLLNQNLTETFNMADTNPITAIIDLFDNYLIPYDKYSFNIAKEFFASTGTVPITMDVVFLFSRANKLTVYQFATEILKRVACDILIDSDLQEVRLYNYLATPGEFMALFSDDYINPDLLKEDQTTEFFNSFSIGVYPQDWAKMIHEYTYEITSNGNTAYIHESYIDTDVWIAGTAAKIKFDTEVGGVFFKSGDICILTGNRTLWSSALDQKTIDLGTFSQESLYGTPLAPAVKEWKDEKSNNAASIVRHTSLSGAFELGNLIVQKYYRKRKKKNFQYPINVPARAGDFVLFRGENYVITKKAVNYNKITNFILEEVLS